DRTGTRWPGRPARTRPRCSWPTVTSGWPAARRTARATTCTPTAGLPCTDRHRCAPRSAPSAGPASYLWSMALTIPSPPINGFHPGPASIHFSGLRYVGGIALAIIITRRRWRAVGGAPALVADVATWAVPAGIIGGRIYFDLTTPFDIPHVWYGVFAVWTGGLGIWGGIAGGAAAGIWRVRRAGANCGAFANAVAPALLVAQAVGRIGNYFNPELFGKPTSLPSAL